jgi:hypothetical protein
MEVLSLFNPEHVAWDNCFTLAHRVHGTICNIFPDEKQIICDLKESNISETWDIECGTMVDSSQDANDRYSAVPSVEPGV